MTVAVRLVANAKWILQRKKILASLEQAECSVLKDFSLQNCKRTPCIIDINNIDKQLDATITAY